MKLFKIIAIVGSMIFAVPALSATLYVKTTGSNSKDCSSWESACSTIAFAVDKASAGDSIYIAKGLYTFSSTLSISGKSLSFIGGFDDGGIAPTGDKHSTIISGDKDNNDSNKSSSGVTLSYNNIVGNNTTLGFSLGAGSYTFKHLTFTGFHREQADAHGAVIFYGNPTGASNVLTLEDVALIGNRAYSMGIVMAYASAPNAASIVIENAWFEENSGDAGIVTAHLNTTAIMISNSTFKNNTTVKDTYGWNYGTAVVWAQGSTALKISDSLFAYNLASDGASAIQADGPSLEITNSTFANNTVQKSSTIDTGAGTVTSIRYSTIYNNDSYGSASSASGGISHNNSAVGSLSLLANLIVANKKSGANSNIYTGNGAINDLGYNLVGHNGASYIVGTFVKHAKTEYPAVGVENIVAGYGSFGGKHDSVMITAYSPARDKIPYDGFQFYGVGTNASNPFTSLAQARASVGFNDTAYRPGNTYYFDLGGSYNEDTLAFSGTALSDPNYNKKVFTAKVDADGWVEHDTNVVPNNNLESKEVVGDESITWIRGLDQGACSGLISTDGRGLSRPDKVDSSLPRSSCDIGAFEFNNYYQVDCWEEDGMRPENNINSTHITWCVSPNDLNPKNMLENMGTFAWYWSLALLGVFFIRRKLA